MLTLGSAKYAVSHRKALSLVLFVEMSFYVGTGLFLVIHYGQK